MTVGVLLDEVVVALATASIPCMLTGSFASAVHGAGRATMDIDLVIDPTASALQQFVAAMAKAGRYVSSDAGCRGRMVAGHGRDRPGIPVTPMVCFSLPII